MSGKATGTCHTRPSGRSRTRRRFAVAVLIPEPVASEIDVLRRALGDPQLDRIAPHITIIPPINLREDDVADAMATVDAAAASCPAAELTVGPVTTFAESSPVRFLAVVPPEPMVALYRACWTGVFARPERRSFHPHVTVDIDGSPTDGPDPAIGLLAGYVAQVRVDAVTLLEHHHDDDGRRWETFVSYRLRGPA